MSSTFERYRRVGFRTVQGWVSPETLDILRLLSREQDRRGISGAAAEIGVHHGRLFIGLQLLNPRGTSVAIDVFEDQASNVDGSGKGNRRKFEANVKRWGDPRRLVIKQGDSTLLTGDEILELAGGPIRLFSIDGGHTDDIVAADMRTAERTLVPGGIVVADDIFNPQWPDVAVGTIRYLSSNAELVPFAIGFNKVYFTDHTHADEYRAAITDAFAERIVINSKRSSFHGSNVLVLWREPRRVHRRVAGRVNIIRRLHERLKSGS